MASNLERCNHPLRPDAEKHAAHLRAEGLENVAVEPARSGYYGWDVTWNTRAAQPVAVEGMPERMRESNEDSDVLTDCHNEGWNASHDAWLAWLSKAAQGLPEPVAYRVHNGKFGQSSLFPINPVAYREQGYDVQDLIDRDAVEPLVAQLRAELSDWHAAHDSWTCQMREKVRETDALRAENEQCHESLKAMTAAYGINCNEVGTLRTANAELVGLLRRIIPSLNAVHDFDLISEIYALLASAGGGDAQ